MVEAKQGSGWELCHAISFCSKAIAVMADLRLDIQWHTLATNSFNRWDAKPPIRQKGQDLNQWYVSRAKEMSGNLSSERRGSGCTIDPTRDSLSAIGHVRVLTRSCQHRSTQVAGTAAGEVDIHRSPG